jgi:hypothetical protein
MLALVAGPAWADRSEDDVTPRLVVRAYNPANVPFEQITTARSVARAILEAAGTEIEWRDCQSNARSDHAKAWCDSPMRAGEVLVRIVTGGANVRDLHGAPSACSGDSVASARWSCGSRKGSTDGPLGFASIDLVRGAGWLATVLADAVRAMAARTGADTGTLLGRVIAHELGHLLLGSSTHSEAGLMRARWHDDDLRQDRPLDWRFSAADARKMRRALQARAREHDR